MSVIRKDLGMVTAYAYAVSKGYTGTEEQFATLMASYADVGQTAVDAALAAKASEDAAKASETASAASQAAAATSAGTATTAAQNASQSATAAGGSATSAAGSATAAAGSATTAGNKATEAAGSATAAAGSATTAGASATAAQAAQTAAETAQTAAETAQGAAEDAAESVAGKSEQIDENTQDISLLKSHLDAMSTASASDEGKALIAKTVTDGKVTEWEFGEAGGGGSPEIVCNASGAVASFADGADGYAVKGLSVALEPIQSGTGDPSPDNVRPISGRQSVTVTRTSTYTPLSYIMPLDEYNGVKVTANADGTVTFKGTCTGDISLDFYRNSGALPSGIEAGKRYIVSLDKPINAFDVLAYKGMVVTPLISFSAESYKDFTVPSDATGMLIRFLAKSGVTYDTTIRIMLCPYDDFATIQIPLGQTVYGGTVDVVSGKMVVDRAMVDLGTLTYSAYNGAYEATISGMENGNDDFTAEAVCSCYKNVGKVTATQVASMADMSIGARSTYNHIFIKDSSAADAAALKTALSGQTLVYPLAAPLTITLTPEQLTTVLGTNNVWSDADSVSVDYVADTKLYIQKAISAAVAALS